MDSLKRFIWLVFLVSLSLVLSSCMKFLKLSEEVKRIERYYYLKGQLNSESKTNQQIWVFVWEKNETGVISITDLGRLQPGGSFVFMVAPSDYYYVGALEDTNGNEYYDPGERIWFYGDPSPVPFTNSRSDILEIDILSLVVFPQIP